MSSSWPGRLVLALADLPHRLLDLVVRDAVLLLQVLEHLAYLETAALVEVAATLVLLLLDVREVLPDRGLGHRELAVDVPEDVHHPEERRRREVDRVDETRDLGDAAVDRRVDDGNGFRRRDRLAAGPVACAFACANALT